MLSVREALADASTRLEACDTATALPLILDAVSTEPDNALAWNQLATGYMQVGQLVAATAAAREAVRLRPDYADAHRNLGMLLLMAENYAEGWTHYKWRHECLDFREHIRPYTHPEWTGKPCDSLLVVCEQGIGDQILYASMFNDLRYVVDTVVVECNKRLVPIFNRSFPHVRALCPTSPPEDMAEACNARIAAGDLGAILRTYKAFFSGPKAYLKPPPYERIQTKRGLQVGYANGSTNVSVGAMKTCPLELFKPMFDIPAHFIPLDTKATFKNLELLAAEIDSCDVVVTVSNTIAHMAGALGKPTIVMLGAQPSRYWYWGLEASTPWYASVKIVRQATDGDWSAPIAEATDFLRGMHAEITNESRRD